MNEEAISGHVQRLATLRTDRSNWDQQWSEAAERIVPAHKSTFFQNRQSPGMKNTELMYDSTAAFAAMRFSSVIESLATPQGSIWHLLKAVDPVLRRNRAVRRYFDDLNEVLWSYRYRPVANFVGNSQQAYLSLGVYGNGFLYIDQPDKQRGLRYKNIHLGEAYIAENHAGIIDTLYRAYKLTARQMIQKYGEENCPPTVIEAAKSTNRQSDLFEVLHCVYPRDDYMPGRVDSKGMPWASVHIDIGTKKLLREGGYVTFPYGAARYSQASGEVYGRGPAQYVLPAIKVLNEEKKTVLKQGHRIVDPVLLAHDDGQLGNFSLKAGALNSGGVNKDGRPLIHALPTGNIAIGDKLMDMERASINDAFLITLFQILVDSPQMTATEVLERAREKGMLLAPTAGRMQAEFLGPMVEREIDVLARQGLLPDMPAILAQQQAEYRVEYDNPLSRMARAESASGFMRALSMASDYFKLTGDRAPLYRFNFERAMPAIMDIQGVPVDWTSTDEEVAGKMDADAKAQQAQQVIDAAPAMASVAKGMA